MTPLPLQIGVLYLHFSAPLRDALRRRSPRACEGALDDAVHNTFVAVLRRPTTFEAAAEKGEEDLRRLMFVVARRALRDTQRRKYQSREIGNIRGPERHFHETPEQIFVVNELLAALPEMIHRAAATHGGTNRAAVASALRDKLRESLSDAAASARHDVPREYVNRAVNALRRQVVSFGAISRRRAHPIAV
jgi:hypothetical protein